MVDLKKNIETMLADCEQTTRQAIRKISNEKRYIVRMADSTREDFDIYVKLHKMTYTRTNCEHAIIRDEYNENIFFNLMPKDLCKVYFLVDEHENKVVAATVILLFKNTAYYWWGASENDKEDGVNKYLLWKVMLEVKKLYSDEYEYFWFETGGIYLWARNGKTKGLSDFKKCYGVKIHPIWTGTYCC